MPGPCGISPLRSTAGAYMVSTLPVVVVVVVVVVAVVVAVVGLRIVGYVVVLCDAQGLPRHEPPPPHEDLNWRTVCTCSECHTSRLHGALQVCPRTTALPRMHAPTACVLY